MSVHVRSCEPDDLGAVARILEIRGVDYARFEPVLWKPKPDMAEDARAHFGEMIASERTVCLVADYNGSVSGFLFASQVPTPPAYEAGPTAAIATFEVQSGEDWSTLGVALIDEAKSRLSGLGYRQIVVNSGYKDTAKMVFLRQHGLSLASASFTAAL